MHSTPHDINLRIDAVLEERENELKGIRFQSWLTGAYVLRAIGCALSKNAKYPENPLSEEEGYIIDDDIEVSEEEKEEYVKMWFDRLEGMAGKHKSYKG